MNEMKPRFLCGQEMQTRPYTKLMTPDLWRSMVPYMYSELLAFSRSCAFRTCLFNLETSSHDDDDDMMSQTALCMPSYSLAPF